MWTYARIGRGLRSRFARKVAVPFGRWRLGRALLRTDAVAVGTGGETEVHILCGAHSVHDGIAALKSFYRFTPGIFPLVVHDDGSLDEGARALLREHLPGLRIIGRDQADAEVVRALERGGLSRCATLRRSGFVFARRLFDVPHYAAGRRVLQLDSDLLFFDRPTELLDALAAPAGAWIERYNEDVSDGWYAYDADAVRRHTGIELVPRYNAGLTCSVRDETSFAVYERCLELPMLEHRGWWQEQTLMAIEASRRGARPLPREYDVAGRASRAARNVVSEHYCGDMRMWFYPHFCARVVPQL